LFSSSSSSSRRASLVDGPHKRPHEHHRHRSGAVMNATCTTTRLMTELHCSQTWELMGASEGHFDRSYATWLARTPAVRGCKNGACRCNPVYVQEEMRLACPEILVCIAPVVIDNDGRCYPKTSESISSELRLQNSQTLYENGKLEDRCLTSCKESAKPFAALKFSSLER
jgi:hypothetical protein